MPLFLFFEQLLLHLESWLQWRQDWRENTVQVWVELTEKQKRLRKLSEVPLRIVYSHLGTIASTMLEPGKRIF